MRFNPQHHDLCVNTILIDKYLGEQDVFERDEKIVYNKMVSILREELDEAECTEDIYSDLLAETQSYINTYSFNADAHEVVKQILIDFDINLLP